MDEQLGGLQQDYPGPELRKWEIDTRLSYLISNTGRGNGKPLQLQCLVAIQKVNITEG